MHAVARADSSRTLLLDDERSFKLLRSMIRRVHGLNVHAHLVRSMVNSEGTVFEAASCRSVEPTDAGVAGTKFCGPSGPGVSGRLCNLWRCRRAAGESWFCQGLHNFASATLLIACAVLRDSDSECCATEPFANVAGRTCC